MGEVAAKLVFGWARASGGDPQPRALAVGPNPLTRREAEVLRAASDGSTVADTVRRPFLADRTVRNYLSSAIGEPGARNRTEAAQVAESRGWLGSP